MEEQISVKFKTLSPPNPPNPILSQQGKAAMDMARGTAASGGGGGEKEAAVTTVPLSEAVSDCARRWFIDTLKEATAGDVSMQVLVSQMYYNGYGVAKNADMAAAWMKRASRVRPSAWKVGSKRPGYEASDSDSDSSSN